jgi:hypothetical protein
MWKKEFDFYTFLISYFYFSVDKHQSKGLNTLYDLSICLNYGHTALRFAE